MQLCVAAVLIACVSSIVHVDLFFLEIIPAIVLLLIGSNLHNVIPIDEMVSIINKAGIIFAGFCSLVVLDFLLGGIFVNPFYEQYSVYLYASGFTGGRTAWAYSSNLFLALLLQNSLRAKQQGKSKTAVSLVAAIVIIVNILIVGARGGFIVAVIISTIFLFLSLKKKSTQSVTLITLLFCIPIGFYMVYDKLDSLRIFTTFLSADTRNLHTAEIRGDLLELGFSSFIQAPLLGPGAMDIDVGAENFEIHSVWFRFILERGVLFGLPLVLISFLILWLSMLGGRRDKYNLVLILAAGVLTGLFEPKAIFGNYFASQVFWLPVSYFLYPRRKFA
ncbi:hypothetical protein [Antarctobacter heliothermus]|nr:hypothetical protein [Antarctobacter heliothermus]